MVDEIFMKSVTAITDGKRVVRVYNTERGIYYSAKDVKEILDLPADTTYFFDKILPKEYEII